MALLDQLLAFAVLCLVVLAPGGAILFAIRRWVALDALNVLPLAAMTTIVLAAPASVVQLGFHLDGREVRNIWGVVTAFGVVACLVVTPRLHRFGRPSLIGVSGLLALAAVGFVVGGLLDGDALYHAMYVERLAELADPTFANTQMFRAGSPHEGYLVPAWHFLAAQAALLAGVDTLDVMRSGPALVLPLAALAFAACTRAVIRTPWAPWAGALAFVLVDVLVPTSVPMRGASIAMWPGSIALWIALPLLLTGWFEAARGRRGWLVPICVAAIVLAVLHVTYVLWIGWLAAAWLGAGVILRHRTGTVMPVVVAVVTATITIVAYVALSTRVLHARDHVITGVAPDREFFERLLLSGSGTRVAPEVYASAGWPTVLGILGAAAAALVLRGRAPLQASVLTLFVIVAAQVGIVGTAIAHVAGLSHVLRLPQVLRAELGIVVVISLAAMLAQVAMSDTARGRRRATILGVLGIATGASIAAAVAWPPAPSRFLDPQIGRTSATMLLAAVTLLAVVAVVVTVRRTWGTNASIPTDRVPALSLRAVVLGTALVVVGTAPITWRALDDIAPRTSELLEPAHRRDKVGRLPASMLHDVRDLPARSVVLASLDMSHVIPAVAPVYVVAYPYVHTAATRANRRDARIRDVRSFTFGWRIPDDWRSRQIERIHADVVLMPRHTAGARFIARHPEQFTSVRHAGDYVLAHVRRRQSSSRSMT